MRPTSLSATWTAAFFTTLALPAGARSGAPTVWTVDDDGPADFQDLPEAVAGAAEGDVLLVRDGSYSSFTIDGKALSVVGEAGAAVRLEQAGAQVVIRNLGPGQSVLLRNVRVSGQAPGGSSPSFLSALICESDQGPILLEDCTFEGSTYSLGWGGAFVVSCTSVTFVRCSLVGRLADDLSYGINHGIFALNASVFVYDSTLLAGDTLGGRACQSSLPYCYQAGHAGHGLYVDNGFGLVSGSTMYGGNGHEGANASPPQDLCGNGADGGHGLYLFASTGVVLDSVFFAGAGGAAGQPLPGGEPCSAGSSGLPILAVFSTLETPTGPRRSIAATTPVREGESLVVQLAGEAGETVVVGAFSDPAGGVYLPQLGGAVLVLFPPAALVVGGPLDHLGQGTLAVPIGELGPGIAGIPIHLQAVFLGGPSGLRLGSPSASLLLDAAL